MAKKNLLAIVQEILSDMDSDAVNSIDDTDEAMQVAQIVKSTYDAMMSNRNWPHTRKVIKLQASTDDLLPTHMTIDEDIKEMISIYYNKIKNGETRLRYEEIKWMDPDDFLRFINKRNSDDENTMTIIDPSGVELLILSNKAPTYYTSFDDTSIVFDSFDSSVDDTLQTSKTQARAYVTPNFIVEDGTIPDLPIDAFSALIEEAKSKAMFKLKQMPDSKAEQEATRQNRWLSRKDWTIKGGIKFPDYGRKRGRGRTWHSSDPTFYRDND